MADNQTLILRVQLDEGKTEEQLAKLVLDIEATKRAQSDLNVMRKNGLVADEAYALQTVALRTQLKGQTGEQTALTKNLELYRKAVGGVGESYAGTQAALSLAIRQQQELAGSAGDTSEASQALTSQIAQYRDILSDTDAKQGAFFRNIGNYPKGENIEVLLQRLVKLEEETKRGTQSTEEAARAQMQIAGFRTQAMQAAAREGKSYEETTSLINGYTAAIRPAVTALVALEKEQENVAEGSEAFAKIGFQISQASQKIQEVPKEVKGVGDSLTDLDDTTNVFGGRVSSLKEQFAQAKQGIELARGGFVGLKGAIAATGIGLLVLTLFALYEAFTQTDEGQEDLAAGLAALKGIFNLLTGAAVSLGKGLIKIFTDPKAAAAALLDFLENQVVNRVKAYGVIFEGLTSGDFTKATNGVLQLATGIENATGKAAALVAELKSAATAAASISRAKDELDDLERNEIVRTEKYRNEIERLVLTAKDRTLSEKERLANLDKAGKLETTLLESTINLARQRLSIIERENFESQRAGKLSDEQKKAAAEAEADVVKLAGQSLSLQQSIQNRRSVLLQQRSAEEKAAGDNARQEETKRAEAGLNEKREQLKFNNEVLDIALKKEADTSAESLRLQLEKLANSRSIELTQRELTVGQLARINRKFELDEAELRRAFAVRQAAEQLKQAKELADKEFTDTQTNLENEFARQRTRVNEEYAQGLSTKQQQEDALSAIERAALQARLVAQQDYGKDTVATAAEIAQQQAAIRDKKVVADKAAAEKTIAIEDARLASAQGVTDAIIGLVGEETVAGQVALALKKTLALAEIGINLSRELSAISAAAAANPANAVTAGIAGISQAAILSAIAIGKAALAAATVLTFRRGGIAVGPSHEQGGIPLYHRGRPAGIEIEGGEPVLTAGVSRSPLLLGMASAINVLAGGVPLLPRAHMAVGGLAFPDAREQLRGEVAPGIDYDRLAGAMSRVKVKATISDVSAGLERKSFTEGMANS